MASARRPGGELPVANAGVNNLQNVSEGFDITLRRVAKVLVVGCCSTYQVSWNCFRIARQPDSEPSHSTWWALSP